MRSHFLSGVSLRPQTVTWEVFLDITVKYAMYFTCTTRFTVCWDLLFTFENEYWMSKVFFKRITHYFRISFCRKIYDIRILRFSFSIFFCSIWAILRSACVDADKTPMMRLEHISPSYHKNTTHLILAVIDEVNLDFEMYLGIIRP